MAEAQPPHTAATPAPVIPIEGKPRLPGISRYARIPLTSVPGMLISTTTRLSPRPEKNAEIEETSKPGRAKKHMQRKYWASFSWISGAWPMAANIGSARGMNPRNAIPPTTENQIPCQTAAPTRCGLLAPVYWATNVAT